MKSIEDYLNELEKFKKEVLFFHNKHLDLFNVAKGSNKKHQAWIGGYRDHLTQCLKIAGSLFCILPVNFHFSSVVLVLYFHDIEKLWKYSEHPKEINKYWFYKVTLPESYKITFTEEEYNALKYIHGEGDDYSDERVMNELAGFCHACDVLSARTFHNLTGELKWN